MAKRLNDIILQKDKSKLLELQKLLISVSSALEEIVARKIVDIEIFKEKSQELIEAAQFMEINKILETQAEELKKKNADTTAAADKEIEKIKEYL